MNDESNFCYALLMKFAPSALLILLIWSAPALAGGFDLQGHRGARGLLPEHSLIGFAKALAIGVTTLEFDVGITRDATFVVSHEPRLSPNVTRNKRGEWLVAPTPAIRELSLKKLQQYDVGRIAPGTRYARRLPHQVGSDGVRIPTLAQVVALTRKLGNKTVRFNIETKIRPDRPDETMPANLFAVMLLGEIEEEGIGDRTTIQSFDWRTLRAVQAFAPHIPTVYLTAQRKWLDNIQAGKPGPSPWTAGLDIDDHGGSVPRLIKAARGKIWSPYHNDLKPHTLREAHDLGLKVVVWTVNKRSRMKKLIEMGVDGIISDYPDRLRAVMAEKGLPLPAATPPR